MADITGEFHMSKIKTTPLGEREKDLARSEAAVASLSALGSGAKPLGVDFSLGVQIGHVCDLFRSVAESRGEWEANSRLLGHRSPAECGAISTGLVDLRRAVMSGNRPAVAGLLSSLEALSLMPTLDGFLSASGAELAELKATRTREIKAALGDRSVTDRILRARARDPMSEPPVQDYVSVGFGLVDVQNQSFRLEAAKSVLAMMDGVATGELPKVRSERARTVAQMFASVAAADKPDWYSLSSLMGHPSSEHCLEIADALYGFASAIKAGDDLAYAVLMKSCVDGFLPEMMEAYIEVAEGRAEPKTEDGMAYIAWSSSSPDTIQIGVAEGEAIDDLEDIEYDMNSPHRYGLLATWLVMDVEEARATIGERLKAHLLPDGMGYDCRLGVAKEAIQNVLDDTENFALSPWHSYDEPKPAPQASMSMG